MRRLAGWIGSCLARLGSAGEKGATTAEYALLLTLVVIILIGTLRALGEALDGKLLEIIQQLGGA